MNDRDYTFGIEIEYDYVPQKDIIFMEKANKLGWKVVHDASCETPGQLLPSGLTLNYSELPLLANNIVLGGELVSKVYRSCDLRNTEKMLYETTKLLYNYGESGKSTRSSIHYHIGMPSYNIRVLKNIMNLAAHLEKVFFQLGGMGYENRCKTNLAGYARPITDIGPLACWSREDSLVPAFVFEDVLRARTTSGFFRRYGDSLAMVQNHIRYAPVRYHWINLLNLKRENRTLEFRVFNYTLNPIYILAVLKLCFAFVSFCEQAEPEDFKRCGFDQQNSAFEIQGLKTVINTLINFAQKTELIDKEDLNILLVILDSSEYEFSLERSRVRCHLSNPPLIFVNEEYYRPPEISYEDTVEATVIDIHRLRGNY